MFCPHCGTEYREGFVECVDCGTALVAHDPAAVGASLMPPLTTMASPAIRPVRPPLPDVELVTVFRSNNRMAIEIAESILRSAEIEFMTRGKDVQGLFGWGAFPAGESLSMGPMEIQVRLEDSHDAQIMLEDVGVDSDADDAGNDATATDDDA